MLEAACTWRISSSSSSQPRLLSNFSPPTAAAARAATCRNVRAAETLASSPSLLVAPRNLGSFKITVRGHFHCDHDYDIGINLRSSHLYTYEGRYQEWIFARWSSWLQCYPKSTCVWGENRCKEGKQPLSWVGDCKIMQNTQFLDVSLELGVSVQVCWGEETVPAPKMIDKPYNQ